MCSFSLNHNYLRVCRPKADLLFVKLGNFDLGFRMPWARLQLAYPCTFLQNKTIYKGERKKQNYCLNVDHITDTKFYHSHITSHPLHISLYIYLLYYTATPRQKGITDNFVKTELPLLPGPEWQYLSVGIIKHPYFRLLNPKNISSKNEFYVQVNGSQAQ